MSEGKGMVLLVDDDQFLRTMYANKFSACGFEVTPAGTGEEALEALHAGLEPDAIVFDVVMPRMDGYAFAAKLVEEKLAPRAAKIALSNEQIQDVKQLAALGIDAQLMKSSGVPSEIVSAVEKIMEAKRHGTIAEGSLEGSVQGVVQGADASVAEATAIEQKNTEPDVASA